MQTQPKNLLIIMSDEHRKDAMGCAGHPFVQTPNLDRLAANGARFDNAYTSSPMCVPTRAAMATGRHVHQIGNWDSATAYDGRVPSWMHSVQKAGVEVTSIGKLHYRSKESDVGFDQQILPMHVVKGVGWAVGLLRDDPPFYENGAELAADVGAGPSTYTNYDLDITAQAEEWLKEARENPWISFVSLVSPHYPLTAPQDYFDMYKDQDLDAPIARQNDKPLHPEIQNIANFFDYDRHFDTQKIQQAKAAYYGLTSFLDDCVGRILAALEESGQAEETLVIYVSDHGDMMGDQGLWTKQVMYEQSVGVPMIIAGPGIPKGKVVKTGASLLDIAPTALGVADAPPNRDFVGKNLIDLANQKDDPNRTIFAEYHDGGSSTGAFMVRWDRWKYVEYVGMRPQLFDLQADPNELNDLGTDPDFQEIRDAGKKRLLDICDPEAVNAQCFADQAKRIAELGGRDACENAYIFNHTPTPSVQAKEGLSES